MGMLILVAISCIVLLGVQATPSLVDLSPGGDVCINGYLSSSYRLWTLAQLPLLAGISSKYLYTLNLCGDYGVPCTPTSVVCQISNQTGSLVTLGQISTGTVVNEISDTQIAITFTKGDSCLQGRAREVTINFFCVDEEESKFGTVTESNVCLYTTNIYIKGSLCRKVNPPSATISTATTTTTSSSTASSTTSSSTSTTGGTGNLCTGFKTPSGTVYNLNNLPALTIKDNIDYMNYTLNACGRFDLPCGRDAVVCQLEISLPNKFSLGRWNTASISEIDDNGNSITVTYTDGTPCRNGEGRKITITYVCYPTTTWFMIGESSQFSCVYVATIYLGSPYCTPSGKFIPSGTGGSKLLIN